MADSLIVNTDMGGPVDMGHSQKPTPQSKQGGGPVLLDQHPQVSKLLVIPPTTGGPVIF